MTLILTVVHVLACLALIFVVLLQKSGGDMGAAFGGGGNSQSLFGARGSGSFLGKVTALLATTFMITSLSLAFFTTQQGRQSSIMEGKPAQETSAPAAAPGDLPLPAKTAADSGEKAPAAAAGKPIPLPDAPAAPDKAPLEKPAAAPEVPKP